MDQPVPTHNQPEFTVSEISARLKRTVEGAFSHVRVRGEISGLKMAGSGHVYFSLKDENAVLNGICWKGVAASLPFKPEDGLEVICVGKISTYPGRSNYQIICDWMEPSGEGALMALLEKRKKELAAEGLFDESRKQPVPSLPGIIGIVTSPTGAVIRDILHRLADRFPRHVLIWPVLVQGEGAAEQIAEAIEGFNKLPVHSSLRANNSERGNPEPPEDGSPRRSAPRDDETVYRPDVLIIARGGGSLEDLWAFNEEIVVRAAANSQIPLISAVGHETDTTLIDLAADKRAPTPTAAAEIAVPVREELRAYLLDLNQRLFSGISRFIDNKQQLLQALTHGLVSPKQLLENMLQRLDDWSERLILTIPKLLNDITEKLANTARLLESYHYKKVLERGFVLVRDKKEKLVTSAGKIEKNMLLQLEFADGKITAAAGENKGNSRKNKGKADKSSDGQSSLF